MIYHFDKDNTSGAVEVDRPAEMYVHSGASISALQTPVYTGGPYDNEHAIIIHADSGARIVDSVLAGFRGDLTGAYTSALTFDLTYLTVSGGEMNDSLISGISQITYADGAVCRGITAVDRGAIVLSSGSVASNITLQPGGTIYMTSGATVTGIDCLSGSYLGIDAGAQLHAVSIAAGVHISALSQIGTPTPPEIRDLTQDLANGVTGNWVAVPGADGATWYQSGSLFTMNCAAFYGDPGGSLTIMSGAVVSGIVARNISVVVQSGGRLISSYIDQASSPDGVSVSAGGMTIGNIYIDSDVQIDAGAISKVEEFYSSATDGAHGSVRHKVEVLAGGRIIDPDIGSSIKLMVRSGGWMVGLAMQANANLEVESLASSLFIDNIDACFLSGVMLLTDSGERKIETLNAGDRLICMENGIKITRIIKRVIRKECQVRHDLPDDMSGLPVRILRDAFAPGQPHSDLLVTAEHCFLFDGKFVPVRMLVNNQTILYDRSFRTYAYFHLEMERHSVIFAQGVATESYFDSGAGYGTVLRQLDLPEEPHASRTLRSWACDAAAPLETSAGFVQPLHVALSERAAGMGILPQAARHEMTYDPVLVLKDQAGRILPLAEQSWSHRAYRVPPGTRRVWLHSRAGRPFDAIGPYIDDRRVLGVLIGEITQARQDHNQRLDAHLTSSGQPGWHNLENARCRWTNGCAAIDLVCPEGQDETILRLEILSAGPYRIDLPEPQMKVA
ncbi:Hint domain-containing protein [Asaia bogorensis]|uniref:Hint domain-containing protein n=1 Tax=Asaia bogorensis TaxID=91915 RepID=UPI000EFB0FEC|nr:Hint domain-containing protein [Asaia bogorensis]